MLQLHQFSIAFFFIAILIVAVLLTFGQIWPVVFLVGQFVLIYSGSEFLIRGLPKTIKQIQKENVVRADQTTSTHRQSVELRELNSLKSNIRLILAIAIVPWILLVWYDSFKIGTIVLGAATWLIFSFVIIRSGYLYYLNQFVFDLKRRSQQYKIRDLDMFIREEEIVAERNRENFHAIEDDGRPSDNPVIISPRPK